MAAAPIVKWVGGKTKLLPELRSRLPETWNRYFEPFVGGGALFFALEPKVAVLGDMNKALVGTYRAVARDVDAVIVRLAEHKAMHGSDENYYYGVRATWNAGDVDDASAERAAMFLYLNKTCFNGLWRVNKQGGNNVPKGDYANPRIYDEIALRAASAVLGRADLRVSSFQDVVVEAEPGDLAYFDPPYDPVSKTANFTSYTKDGFGREHQERLASVARGLVDRGVQVVLSNHDTPFIRSLYQGFRIDTVRCPRAINSKGDKRGAVDEVIICGGYG